MFRKLVLLLALGILAATVVQAQDDEEQDDTEDTTSFTSTVQYFAVLCEDRIVIELTGTMQSGYDLYYQVFSGQSGAGTALTNLRQVQVSGEYAVSDVAQYTNGTLPGGTVGSAYIAIGREGNPDSTLFTTFVDDVQDGCVEASQLTPDASVDTGTDAPTTDDTGAGPSPGTDPSTGTSRILSPFGGVVNPGYVPPDKPLVQIGARDEVVTPRQETPGLIFAECEDFPVAEPGIIYDTDNVVVFWSWFTETDAQMQNHIANVNYSVTYYQTLVLPNVFRTQVQEINGLNWVFYYSVLGNLLPGRYYIEYKVTWDEVHFDGITEYGPGTANEELVSGCEFVVLPNPEGVPVSHNPWPYQFITDP